MENQERKKPIQVTNEALINVLQQYPKDYIVEIGINEEMDLLKHIFVDSDNGVIELTSFEEEDKSKVGFYDMFDGYITEKTLVLYVNKEGELKKGKIKAVSETHLFGSETKSYIVFLEGVNNGFCVSDRTNKLIKYDY